MARDAGRPLELWGGVECTVNRVGDTFRDQLVLSGHAERLDDLDRFAALGLRTLRFPVLWERVAPDGLDRADWRWTDAGLERMRALGLTPIVGLLHHGSGPASTSLVDPGFPEQLAAFARAVAERYPWVTAYTPLNEPLTTARFSALYGHWYPHEREDRRFIDAVLLQCRGIALAMEAIRSVRPDAVLVQTEDLGRTYSTRMLQYQAVFDNERRWLPYDLLTGRLAPADRMWRYMRDIDITEETLEWFVAHPSLPVILGVNHYVTSNRYLDSDLERYPPVTWGGNGRHRYADVEAVRVLEEPAGPAELLLEAWARYRLPLAVTEVHLGCTREDQLRWLHTVWEAAGFARERGADIRAVTAWALLGSFDWDSLLTRERGHYEPGAFDVRGPAPRLTALGRAIGALARGVVDWPAPVRGPGWWARKGRHAHGHGRETPSAPAQLRALGGGRPIVVTGARGTLAAALGRVAESRGLEVRLLPRSSLDIASAESAAAALARHRPWAVINAAGYVRVDEAEHSPRTCFRENTTGVGVLGAECERMGIPLVTFSTDLVFGGDLRRARVESDPVGPLNVYGASKVEAERLLAAAMPAALIVRTSAFFGPWDEHNMLTRALAALRAGGTWEVPPTVVSPTYVPDLANAVLDLLIDGEHGIWHLANVGEVSWLDFIRRGAAAAGVDASGVRETATDAVALPPWSALGTERGALLPSLDDAIERYAAAAARQASETLPASNASGA